MSTDHIKIPDIEPIVRYTAGGTQTVFTYPFPVFASEDLAVYLDGAKQSSGFTISGAGETAGGTVTFDSAPVNGTVVTLSRELSIERITDFLEGGDFSAASINNELDYLIAALQQVNRENDVMLKYSDHEMPGAAQLPGKTLRANKALGFDGNGDPVALSLEGSMAAPDFTASGTGAVTRTSHDKFSDLVSVKDFGAAGDGLTDDTLAIQQALAAHNSVLLPKGLYLISGTIALGAGQSLIGLGNQSVIKCQSNGFNAVEIQESFNIIQNLKIEGGSAAVKLFGDTGPCMQNSITDIEITGAETGILLDGHSDSARPCKGNSFARILIDQPGVHGVHLTKTGAGSAPASNRFYGVRVRSNGAATAGSGFYVAYGANANSFIDCEADVNGASADSCMRVGANAAVTFLVNLHTVSGNLVPNVKLDAGSSDTSIINLHGESDGAAIEDNSGGSYHALNAGMPEKNTLRKTTASDLKATLMRYDTEFINTPGTTALDLSHSMHIVDATGGAVTLELPAAASAPGAEIAVKKSDDTGNIITITENGGPGPDGKSLPLGGPNDYAVLISNGAEWFIKSSNRMAGNTRFIDSSGTVDIDMAVDTYLVSSFGGALTTRLPPANAPAAIGRTVTIKKTDSSANTVTVSEQGGNGPDQSSQVLSAQYDAVTVVSNGANWFVVSKL